MKRFLIIVIVLSILISCFVFSASAATSSNSDQFPYTLDQTLGINRLDPNSTQGWYSLYTYNDNYPLDNYSFSYASPMMQMVVDYYTFVQFDFKIYRTDGNPLAYAGNDIFFTFADIYAQHWYSHNDKYYTWTNAALVNVIVEFTDGSTIDLHDSSSLTYNDATSEFSLSATLDNSTKDVASVLFKVQYWPTNYDGIKVPLSYFQITWFSNHPPAFYITSFPSSGSSGGTGSVPEGIGGMIDSIINNANSGFDSLSSFYENGLGIVNSYSGALRGVTWILSQVISVDFVSDLTTFSASLGIVILLFGVSLTVGRSLSSGRSSKKGKGG